MAGGDRKRSEPSWWRRGRTVAGEDKVQRCCDARDCQSAEFRIRLFRIKKGRFPVTFPLGVLSCGRVSDQCSWAVSVIYFLGSYTLKTR